MISTFLFDIGNVVWDYQPLFDLLQQNWAQLLNLPLDEFKRIYVDFYQKFENNTATLTDFLTLHGHPELEPQFQQALQTIYDTPVFDSYLHSSVLNLIADLRPFFQVGYLSNAEYFFYPHVHQKLEKYFDWGFSSWQLACRKPSIEIFQQTLALRGLDPSQVVFIDDVQKNIDAALTLGLHALRFQSDRQLFSDLQSLTPFIGNVSRPSSPLLSTL